MTSVTGQYGRVYQIAAMKAWNGILAAKAQAQHA